MWVNFKGERLILLIIIFFCLILFKVFIKGWVELILLFLYVFSIRKYWLLEFDINCFIKFREGKFVYCKLLIKIIRGCFFL